ncbi:MAG: histidinol dehydrogenase [Geminicoccaceae bacterium]|nr:histidinol dehydrogenase [Geminicoccaceae bacterium]
MTRAVALHELARMDAAARARLLLRAEDDLGSYMEKVAPVIEAVRVEGDAAIARYIRQFDGVDVDPGALRATEAEFDEAFATLDPAMIETLDYAADNIRRFHEDQMPREMWTKEIRPGVLVGERHTAVESAALYSPRGKGSFPSVTLMTAIPAVVAGVPLPVILTPPGPDGKVDAATLVAARLAGVKHVYRAGGPLAVAAAAFGTETIPRCRKLEGPGSPWFAAARRLLAHRIASRLPAGPSETIVLADETADPAIAGLDIIIESEHGPDSSAFLVTWSREVAEGAMAAIPGYWAQMGEERVSYSSTVLSGARGGVVLTSSPREAYDFINDYAPEHCQVLSRKPFEHLSEIRNASEILLGEYAAGSIANYMMGPNCVLPTSGAAHTHSPLGVHDFLKSCSIGHMTRRGYEEMAPLTHRFATYEGFDAHANAVSALRKVRE